MTTIATTRRQAKDSGLVKYFTGNQCPHGHSADRFTSTGSCIECAAFRSVKRNEDRKRNTEAKRRQRESQEYRLLEAERRRLNYKRKEWDATLKKRSTKAGWLAHVLRGAKNRAKGKGMEFTITAQDVIVPDVCPVFGVELDFSPSDGSPIRYQPNRPSIDRINNSIGYVPGNVRVISYRANALKSDSTLSEMQQICAYMSGGEPSPQ